MSLLSKHWPAPAKLNRFLHITGRREDGYHELQTVFQFLDHCDELDFEIIGEPDIMRVSEIHEIPQEDDLIVRAAKLLQEFAGITQGAKISIRKQIPMGGGVGGGSSDAATTLLALNHLWQAGVSREQLCELGLKLGADVPVFIHGQATFAEGVGEKFQPVELDQPYFIVLRPDVSISTAKIFTHPELTRNTPPITIRDFLAGAGHNDCEPLVRKLYPEVDKALNWLEEYSHARLTGTGSCIFAAFSDKAEAERILAKRLNSIEGFVSQGLNYSPLLSRLDRE